MTVVKLGVYVLTRKISMLLLRGVINQKILGNQALNSQ